MWWAVATLTTVGYGDIYPVSTIGQVVGGITMVLGVFVIALPVVLIGNNFETAYVEFLQEKLIADDVTTKRPDLGVPALINSAIVPTSITKAGFLSPPHHKLVSRFVHEGRWHTMYTLTTIPMYYTPTCVWDCDSGRKAIRYTHDAVYNVLTAYIVKDTPQLQKTAYTTAKTIASDIQASSVVAMPTSHVRVVLNMPKYGNVELMQMYESLASIILTGTVHSPENIIPVSFLTIDWTANQILEVLPHLNISLIFGATFGKEVEVTVSSMAMYAPLNDNNSDSAYYDYQRHRPSTTFSPIETM
jgi:hypothetical protein